MTDAWHGRLPWFRPGDLDSEQRRLYDALVGGKRDPAELVDEEGRLHGAFNARLLAPEIGEAVQAVGAALRFSATLTPRERELAILEVARFERCNYEWAGHAAAAARVGISEAELEAVLAGNDIGTLTTSERLVRRVVSELLRRGDLDDALFSEAEASLDVEKIFVLVSIVGHYRHTALALRVWRVPLRDGMDPVFP